MDIRVWRTPLNPFYGALRDVKTWEVFRFYSTSSSGSARANGFLMRSVAVPRELLNKSYNIGNWLNLPRGLRQTSLSAWGHSKFNIQLASLMARHNTTDAGAAFGWGSRLYVTIRFISMREMGLIWGHKFLHCGACYGLGHSCTSKTSGCMGFEGSDQSSWFKFFFDIWLLGWSASNCWIILFIN